VIGYPPDPLTRSTPWERTLRVRSELRMKRVDCIENRSDLTNARIGSALVALRIL